MGRVDAAIWVIYTMLPGIQSVSNALPGEIDEYMATTDFTVARNGFILSAKEQQQRFIIKNLMYYMGIDKAEYTRRFGEPLDRTPLFLPIGGTSTG